jgi:hypothetical protein
MIGRGSRGERVSDFRRNGHDRTTEALDEYLRALGRSARDQIVAEAEAEVCRAWADELARVRRVTETALAAARTASRSAQALVREHQQNGDLHALLDAQGRLEEARAHEQRSSEASKVLFTAVTEEQELLAIAAEERETVALANRIWISSASRAVYAAGASDGEYEAGPGSPESGLR